MADLKFADTHNLVAFLSKPAKSEGFKQIVDFLNAQPIRYALTVNPTIYISCIEQLWSSGVVKLSMGSTVACPIDGKKIMISEASARRDLQLKGIMRSSKTTVWNEFRSTMASALICLATNQKFSFSKSFFVVRAATTTSSLEAEQDSGNITKTLSKVTPNEYSSLGTTSGGGPRVLDLEKTKTTQQNEIDSLKRRVKKLEKKNVFVQANENVVEEVLKLFTPKVKGIVFQETGKSMTTTISSQQSQDKGKGIMIKEPVKPMKKKDLINLDEEAKIEADHELAQRLQAGEQEELSVEEKAKLLQQLLEQRRKHFAAKKSTKKQKVDDDKDTAELQSLMEVIPNEEEVAIDVVPLATNSLKIVD
ncbi:hypothetical protein Tco_1008454 [Tanacetum coccineum]